MKLVRFQTAQGAFSGMIEGNEIKPWGDNPANNVLALSDVRLLTPCTPSKVVAVGLNYKD
ncbi:MAG: fumarylacetoacetate hydrolase family protein, partial [Desulfomonilaceae bacterium]